jgi:hypothetical protein
MALVLLGIVLATILLFNRQTQGRLRVYLEKRWNQPARIVNTLAAAGAFAGLISFGPLPISLIIFALAMEAAVKLVGRWGWLDSRLNYAQTRIQEMRRPLRLLYVAAVAPLLISWPLLQLWMVVSGIVAFPVGIAYGHLLSGNGALARAAAEEKSMLYVAFALGVLLYCALVNYAFRRLSGIRSRALAWQFVGWIFLLMHCLQFLDGALGIHHRAETFSDMFLPLLLMSIVTAYLLKQAGSVFGRWLARSAAAN